MTNPINNYQISDGPSIFYDELFRVTLETHLNYLRTDPQTRMLDVTPTQAYRHEHDFYGLLVELNIPTHLHWLMLRLNNLTDPMDADRDIVFVLYPAPAVLDLIKQRHLISFAKTK